MQPTESHGKAFDTVGISVSTSLTAAYAHNGDPDRVLSLLATWLGHSDAAHTYWYLSATGELMALAAGRLEPNTGTDHGEPS